MRWDCKDPQVPEDYFGNQIAVGDRYFSGLPCQVGRVVKVRPSFIEIEYGEETSRGWVSRTTKRKSPEQGVCLDKIPTFNYDCHA